MSEERSLSVSEVLGLARRALQPIRVHVVGEVSEVRDKPGYKAVYFSLCDESAVLKCLMWRDAYETSEHELEDGILIEAVGGLDVYPARGQMQFQVRSFSPAGEGALRLQVAALARRLEAEGLMLPERKRALPSLPVRVGLVTSPRGKAVHDVLRTLGRRHPMGEVVLAGVPVEGRDAHAAIVDGLRCVVQEGRAEVVILCRGGGSYEDLMPFNREEVARAVVACPVPVVTGIGHEPDTTIADMVADVRASTPTAAAEAVAPSTEEIARRLDVASAGLARGLGASAARAAHRIRLVTSRPLFCDASALLAGHSQRVDTAADGLTRALPGRLDREGVRFRALSEGLVSAGSRVLERAGTRVERAGDRLSDLSPLHVLGRGYAICYGPEGRAVDTAAALRPGDSVGVRFARGRADCTVDAVETED